MFVREKKFNGFAAVQKLATENREIKIQTEHTYWDR